MVHQRLIRSVTLLFVAGLTFVACGPSEPQTPQEKYCAAKCACNKCTPTESATCRDDMINLEEEAKAADCGDPYGTLLSCLNRDGVCTDGAFDESACFNEETDLKSCIKPPPVCATVDDGICNEPSPAGNGTCATGTDTKDCMIPACATANDGFCDEPEGSGFCADGTDPLDCPCTSCFTYASDPAMKTLCETSKPLYDPMRACACDNAKCLGSCGDLGDICDNGILSSACYTCLNTVCPSETNACAADG
jgi:hypothetical protein